MVSVSFSFQYYIPLYLVWLFLFSFFSELDRYLAPSVTAICKSVIFCASFWCMYVFVLYSYPSLALLFPSSLQESEIKIGHRGWVSCSSLLWTGDGFFMKHVLRLRARDSVAAVVLSFRHDHHICLVPRCLRLSRGPTNFAVCMCVCVCICVYIWKYTHIYISICASSE